MDISIIFLVLILSAFFSGMEIAFFSSDKLRIELDKKKNFFFSFFVSTFLKNPKQYVATLLVGNNVALVIYGILMTKILEPSILYFIENEIIVLLIQTIISTLIILFTAEFLPKTIFRTHSNLTLRYFSSFAYFFYLVLFPFAKFMVMISNLFIKNKSNLSKEKIAFGKVDLDNFLKQNQNDKGKGLKQEIKIFQNALDFSNITLRECIIPRTEIIALENTSSVETIRKKFIEISFSKILIYDNNIDNIIAYVHSSSFFKKPKNLDEILIKIPIFPLSMSAQKSLKMLMKERKSIALVVDEFGGTSGIVTIEDILEEIFGDIQDEYDKNNFVEKQISETEFQFSGRLEIDYVNEKYKINLSKLSEFETISGLIYHFHESIPKHKEKIIIDNFEFSILKATKKQILLVHIKII
ncbi:MAG: hemolysin [Bacteroidetes bacterium 4572_128]|nr:MAG: hemolysin [Bacteroidetes bacterium 4572_128]